MRSFGKVRTWIKEEANFYRLHLLFFTIVPIISSGLFYAGNGEFHISYIDSLFLCYSALTVTGLSTVNLSTCTGFQQALLFILMVIGDITIGSWVMILVRKRYFRQHCEAVVRDIRQRHRVKKIYRNILKQARFRYYNQNTQLRKSPLRSEDGSQSQIEHVRSGEGIGAGLIGSTGLGLAFALPSSHIQEAFASQHSLSNIACSGSPTALAIRERRLSQESRGVVADAPSFTSSPRSAAIVLPMTFDNDSRSDRRPPIRNRSTARQYTMKSSTAANGADPVKRKDQNMGGFPGPFELFARSARAAMPRVYRWITTLPILHSNEDTARRWHSIGFDGLSIGRNSHFNTELLSDEELEALGGIEYRALRALSYIVIIYFIGVQLISFIVITSWINSTSRYDSVFQDQFRFVPKTWFTAFQVVGAYTGGGMSLVDLGMIPFQQAWVMIFVLIFAILCGNHGMPILLRLIIWTGTKLVKEDSPADKTLHFLLDHPRRCFLYLFPSHVTWYLFGLLVIFTAIEWTSFIVLNIGLPVIDGLSPGTQATAGLFQSFAVRASGFQIVPIASLSPAFQFLCVIMMYIAVFPVALSIRSTNVYEEKSLGIFEIPPEDEDEEPVLDNRVSRPERISRYIGWHLRRQVAFDIWWLVWGVWLICIIERGKLMDPARVSWFNIFRIIFEMVSAFGGIGLTLGVPYDNFSFCGDFRVLSKLIVCVIMVRGRQRGLPVAIDRAIMLPSDLIPNKPVGPDARSEKLEQ